MNGPGLPEGAQLTTVMLGRGDNRWHGTGLDAPDVRRGAKPCPLQPQLRAGPLILLLLFLVLVFLTRKFENAVNPDSSTGGRKNL